MSDPATITAVTIQCDCGWKLGVLLRDLSEVAAGVWGTIHCQACNARLNDKIKQAEAKEGLKPA